MVLPGYTTRGIARLFPLLLWKKKKKRPCAAGPRERKKEMSNAGGDTFHDGAS